VVDTPSSLVPVTLAVLDEADLVVLVVTPELPALRNAARFLRLAAQLGLPSEKILLLANRADAGRQIDSAVMEEHLHQPVAGAISFDARIVVDCVNAGELLVAAAPGNRVSEGIETLTREVARRLGWAPPAPVPERRERSRPEAAPAGAAPAGATSPVLALFQRLARRLGAAPQ
jgi:pilus assembly protein CpaE